MARGFVRLPVACLPFPAATGSHRDVPVRPREVSPQVEVRVRLAGLAMEEARVMPDPGRLRPRGRFVRLGDDSLSQGVEVLDAATIGKGGVPGQQVRLDADGTVSVDRPELNPLDTSLAVGAGFLAAVVLPVGMPAGKTGGEHLPPLGGPRPSGAIVPGSGTPTGVR